MTALLHQPSLTEGLTLLGWKLKRDAEIRGKHFFFGKIFLLLVLFRT
jgi:hypothetical protein